MQPGSPPVGERWNVNMPAVIGVVFVFLIGVVVWVMVTSGDDEPSDSQPVDAATTTVSGTTLPGAETTVTLSPTPLPETTPPTDPVPTSSEPAAPVTAAPGAVDGAVPGDLAVPGYEMQRPPCDGGYITVLASPIGGQATAAGIASVLEQYPGSNYLRTDQTCTSLNPDVEGEPIYVIFFGPFAFDSDACAARAEGPEGAYARQLSNDVGPGHSVSCS